MFIAEFEMKLKTTVNHCEQVLMPELLAGLTDRNVEILLGFKEKTGETQNSGKVKSVHQKPSQTFEPHENDEEPTDLDLTGSPLGADFDPHQKWNLSCPDIEEGSEERVKSGPKYSGVSLSQARGWLTEVSNSQECWAVLDGEDKDKTVYLGSRVENDKRILSRVVSYPAETSKVLSGHLGRVLALHTAAGAGHRTVKYRAKSELNLINSMSNDGSSIKIVSSWNKVNSLLEFPPADAETRLHVTVVAGDDKLDTRQLWTELQLLSGFVRGLAGEGVTWLGGEDGLELETLVSDIIEAVRQIGPRSGVTKLESETLMDHQDLEPFSFKARQEVDFTDILWSSLYKVQSYHELTEAFKMVFSTIIQEEIRPFIYARNKTSVVRLVNSIVRGSETLPDMSGSLPLEMLIECGLEKLQRDYSHTLLNSELASKESIAQFLASDNQDEAVKKLFNLHLVVELAVLLETHTKLSSDILRSIVSTALSTVPEDSIMKRSYEFSVPTQALEMLFIQCPDIWQLKLSTGINIFDKLQNVTNVYCLDIKDSCLTRGVDTTVRILQHTYNDDNDPEFVMYVNNEVSRSVMN